MGAYTKLTLEYSDGLVQDYCNSSVLAIELLQFYAEPSLYISELSH